MGTHTTITAKIPVEHKAKLKEHRVNINRLINEAVAREVQRLEDMEYQKLLTKAAKILQKAPEDHLVGLIRSSRDER